VNVMHETNDFFQEQANECQSLAEGAGNKADQEFWSRLAHQWEELLQTRKRGSVGTEAELTGKVRFGRSRFTRRHAA
jgi:hypothetical protein